MSLRISPEPGDAEIDVPGDTMIMLETAAGSRPPDDAFAWTSMPLRWFQGLDPRRSWIVLEELS